MAESVDQNFSLFDQLLMASSVPPPLSATSAICGFDVGSENCYIAVARAGGIEILLNEYSQRSTPAYIAFGDKQRELGVSAKQKQMMNLSNTCFAPNRLIGRQLKDVTEELPFQAEPTSNGEIAVRVWHNGEEQVFTATQIMAMLFTKLRQVSSNSIDCVVNCPNYFTDSQRRALMDAAAIAGLNPIRIIPDMTAISLYYGFYRTAPSEQETTIAAFIDCGHSSTQCAVVLFNQKEHYFKVLSVEYEMNCGGKHLDEILANYFIDQHKLKLNKRSRFRLIAECEKLKKQMSANSNDLPLNIECLYDEKDFSSKMNRVLFEKLSEPLFNRLSELFSRTLVTATDKFNTELAEKFGDFRVDACEIVGGTSRVPAIKRLVKSIFGVKPTTTLNADEAVARGCALQCAMLSPTFKVARQMQIIDYAPFQIDFRYWHQSSYGQEPESKSVRSLFSRGHALPFTKQISINCQSLPIIAAFDYVNDSNQIVPIGEYKIYSTQNIQINKNQLKLKVRLDNNGIVVIYSASVTIEASSPKKNSNNSENQVEDIEMNNEQNSSQTMETEEPQPSTEPNENSNNTEAADHKDPKEGKKPKKPKATSVELQIEPLWIRGKLSDSDLQKYKEIELNLILADKNCKEKMDAKNALEEYIYEWRDKLEAGGYDPFVENNEKQSFLIQLQTEEQWLYDQEDSGVVHSKSVYEEKLNKMRDSFSAAILKRKREFETRPSLLEQLGQRLQQSRKIIETAEEVERDSIKKLETETELKQKWFDESCGVFQSTPTTCNPSITCDQIKQQTDSLDSIIRQIVNDRHRRHEEKRRQAEAAKQPPPQQNAEPQQQQQQQQQQHNNDKVYPNSESPHMEVDDEIHPTI